jgi:N-acetylglucosamine-6-sulfatase
MHFVHRKTALLLSFAIVLCGTPAVADQAHAVSTQHPNVVLIVSDDQGADSVAHAMPWLSSQPGGSWYQFSQSVQATDLCCPGRASILTGQTPFHHHVFGNASCAKFDDSEDLPVALQRSGYRTGYFGKLFNCYPSSKWLVNKKPVIPKGWDAASICSLSCTYYGFKLIEQTEAGVVQSIIPKTDDTSYEPYFMKNKAIAFINSRPADQPWFVEYSPFAPHAPFGVPVSGIPTTAYTKPPDAPNWYEGCAVKGPAHDLDVSDKTTYVQSQSCLAGRATRASGMKSVVPIDRAFREIYDTIDARGELDNTVFIFTSDNANALGAHRISGKQCWFEECLDAPLWMRIPGRPGGVVDRMVSNIDILPTIMDLTGSTTTLAVDGLDVVPLIDGDQTGWRTDQLAHDGNPASAPTGQVFDLVRQDCAVNDPCYKYVEHPNGERELYDLTADPHELLQLLPNDLTGYAGQPGWDDSNPVVQALTQRLHDMVAAGR